MQHQPSVDASGVLPGPLGAELRATLAPDENVQAAFEVDLTPELRFAPGLLVLSDRRLDLGFSFGGKSIWNVIIAIVVVEWAYYARTARGSALAERRREYIEAAECLGLSRAQTYWHVVLRPAIERVYPALVSQYVLLMLASSITSQISAEELTAVANRIQSDTFRSFETYIVVGLLYLALSFVVRWAFWGFGMLVFTRRRKLGTAL